MIPRIRSAPLALPPHALTRQLLLLRAHRFASSSARDSPENRANPPASTLPAPLDVPRRGSDQSYLSYLFSSGKAYLGFYKTGIKNVWQNYKLANEVKTRARRQIAAPGANAPSVAQLTRSEFQLLRRSKYDLRRAPVFAVLLLLMGEWLPLVVIFLTRLVPLPCRIPGQIDRELQRHEAQRQIGRRMLRQHMNETQQHGSVDPLSLDLAHAGRDIQSARSSLHHYTKYSSLVFNLHSPLLDRLRITPLLPRYAFYYKARKHLDYLAVDDEHLLRDCGEKALRPEELRVACAERGIDVLSRKERDLRADLKQWLAKRRGKAWANLFFR